MWAVIGISDLSKNNPCRTSWARRMRGAPVRVLCAVTLVSGAAALDRVGAALASAAATLTAEQAPRPLPQPMAGWLGVWLGTGLAVLVVGLALVTVSRWSRRFALRDLVLVALTTGMAFLLVTIPGFMTRSVSAVLLGPFSFFVEGLIFKLVLFLLLGTLFALVRRPGVFFLFFGLWTIAQALLNGHYSPMMVLFSCSTIFIIEIALWLSGVTRPNKDGAPPHWFSGAVVVGLGEGFTVFWSLNLIVVLFRVYLAEWFVLLQAATEAVYAGLGLMLGLRMGTQLRRIRRPAVEFAAPEPEARPAHSDSPRNQDKSPARMGQPPEPSASIAPEAHTAPAAYPAPLLEVENLTFAYPGQSEPVLKGVGLRVNPGEIVLLAGPSGVGKTTLLRLIQGLLPWPGEAGLRFSGEDGATLPPPARALRCGLLFQEPALQVVRSTVAGDVAFGCQILHENYRHENYGDGDSGDGDSAQGAERTRQALEIFGLKGLAGRATHTLSGGELQLTALAGVVAPGPPLLLLDEPLANLDKAGRTALVKHLRDLAGRGLGIVVAEHRLEPLLRLARHVLWLEPGGTIQQGGTGAHPAASAAPGREPEQMPGRFGQRGTGSAPTSVPPAGAAASGGATEPAMGVPPAGGVETQALLQCRDVSFRHSQAQAPILRGIRAALYPGQAVALSGANGAGKTTLLALILGLAKPSRGSVTVQGRAAHRLSWKDKSRLFGYLPQQAELLLQAPTVAEELAFALRCQGKSSEFIEAEVAGWLQRLELQAMATRAPHLLSRGEKQRLALGAVMIGRPGILVLDEPFAGQDPRQMQIILELCGKFLAESPRRSLLATTHDLESAQGFFHAEWHLADGRIASVDDRAGDTVKDTVDAGPAELQPPLPAASGGGA